MKEKREFITRRYALTWNFKNEGKAKEMVTIWVSMVYYLSLLKFFIIKKMTESKNLVRFLIHVEVVHITKT